MDFIGNHEIQVLSTCGLAPSFMITQDPCQHRAKARCGGFESPKGMFSTARWSVPGDVLSGVNGENDP